MTLTLTIPQPCQQSWAAMTPAAGGRHCAACQKTVVDFTTMGDAEILAYLATVKQRNVCGRFAEGQLSRPLLPLALPPAGRWRTLLAATAAVLALRSGAALPARAQAAIEQRELPANSPLNYAARPDFEGARPLRPVRGQVLAAATGLPLPGALVALAGTGLSTLTGADGRFSLPVPDQGREITLRIISLPYREERQTILPGTPGVLVIEMQAMEPLQSLAGLIGGVHLAVDIKTKAAAPAPGASLWDWLRWP